MSNSFEVIPSPGTTNATWQEIEKKIELVKSSAKTIHVDIVDGKFAPTITFADPKPFQKYTSDILFEVHLMVNEPVEWVERFGKAGFRRFAGQIEKMSDQAAFVIKAREYGEAILAIDATTSIHDIAVPFEEFDGILVMTIHAGFSGQEFLLPLLEKVRHLRRAQLPIEVDGGINFKTIQEAKDAGAVRFVATTSIFSSENPRKIFELLTRSVV